MFDFPNTKVFMDMVHGYIHVPKVFVKHIIDTVQFQRLRNIDQTGMRPVYPAAKHDRFIHSLGVYFLGLRAVDALLSNFKGNHHWNIRSDGSQHIFWAKNKLLFLLACLLHDIGHAPFSHSMESFYVEDANKEQLHERLRQTLGIEQDSGEFARLKNAAAHEKMSAFIVIEQFQEQIGQILDELGKDGYPQIDQQSNSEYSRPPLHVDRSELDDDVRFIARMIMGVKYESFHPESQIRNCFVDLLNGQNFDVDKLDYIIRDTRMSGISNITLDAERLINSLTIIATTRYHKFKFTEETGNLGKAFLLNLAFSKGEPVSITGHIDNPLELRKGSCEIYPDTIFSLCNASMQNPEETMGAKFFIDEKAIFSVPPSPEGYIRHLVDGSYVEVEKDSDETVTITTSKTREQTYSFRNATVVEGPNERKTGFQFRITSGNRVCLSQGKGEGRFRITSEEAPATPEDPPQPNLSSSYFKGSITGVVEDMEVLGDTLRELQPNETAYTSFAIGFTKKAVNVITNVMEARNYLYLWIYAHHKVAYYANYLVIELSRLSKYILDGQQLSTLFSCDAFLNNPVDEISIVSMARQAHTKAQEFSMDEPYVAEFYQLYDEYFSRQYKMSVYKTLVEFDVFFQDFSTAAKEQIRNKLPQITKASFVPKAIVSSKYGVWESEELKKIGVPFLDCLMWVDPSYTRKMLDMDKMYLLFSDKSIVNVERLPMIRNGNRTVNTGNLYYFYLYYHIDDSKIPSEMGFSKAVAEIKEKLLEYFYKLTN